MMWITKSRLLLNTIFSLFLFAGYGQTVSQTEAIADSFMVRGEYYTAAKYYARVYFFAPKSYLHIINAKLGDAYFGKGDFKRAYRHYDNAQKLETVDSLKSEWFLRKISALIMQKKFNLALLDILNFRGKLTSLQRKKINFLRGTVYFGQEKFDLAKKYFKKALPSKDSVAYQKIDSLFSKKNLMHPNPETAKWLSIAMPGLGQLYAGDWKNAANSFALNMSLFYLFARDALRFSFFESFVVFYPWIQRYYQGGFERAERIARKKRKQKRAEVYKKIYHTVL